MKNHLFILAFIALLFSACSDSDCPEPTTNMSEKDPSTWTLTKWEILNGAFYADDVFQYNFSAVSDTIERDELSLRDNGSYIFDLSYKGTFTILGANPERLTGLELEVGSYQKVSSGTTGTIDFFNSSGTQRTMAIFNETASQLIIGMDVDESFDNEGVKIRQTGTIKYTFKK